MERKNEQSRVYEKNRFEFSIWVNEFLICRRNFRINNFSEVSMKSLDFKNTMDDVVSIIDNDMKSKSRIYTWYYHGKDCLTGKYDTEEIEEDKPDKPWSTTFKIIITDNDIPVFTKIWDGSYFPKDVRQNIDIINKYFQIGTYANGEPILIDYDKIDTERLDADHYIKYHMCSNRANLSDIIISEICGVCSPEHVFYENGKQIKRGMYSKDSHYNTTWEDGKNNYYRFNSNWNETKYVTDWSKAVKDRTINYYKNECGKMFD